MATLVSDLSDISRIESGRLHLELESLSMTDLVDEVVRSARQQLEARKQRINAQVSQDLPSVWGDRNRLANRGHCGSQQGRHPHNIRIIFPNSSYKFFSSFWVHPRAIGDSFL